MSIVQRAILRIQELARENGGDLKAAARRFSVEQPMTTTRVLDIIGSYPNSEPELAALQRVP